MFMHAVLHLGGERERERLIFNNNNNNNKTTTTTKKKKKKKNSSKKNVRVKINSLNVIDRIYPQVLEIINKQRNINGAPQKSALHYSISENLYTIRKGFS